MWWDRIATNCSPDLNRADIEFIAGEIDFWVRKLPREEIRNTKVMRDYDGCESYISFCGSRRLTVFKCAMVEVADYKVYHPMFRKLYKWLKNERLLSEGESAGAREKIVQIIRETLVS